MNKKIFSAFGETHIFYSVLILNLILISAVKYYPSMDGPAHLYNSNLIGHLIKGDCNSITDFFTLNKALIPNWTDHFILSALCFIFPAWIAEKAFLFIYIIGLAFSFRLLIRKLCPGNIYLSIFIFPFAYSLLFHLGFYNYCISFVFLFFSLYFWIKNRNQLIPGNYTILFILINLTYFSNVVTYCYLGMCLGLFTISYELSDYNERKDFKSSIKSVFKKLVFL
jgi:hypothetical protein